MTSRWPIFQTIPVDPKLSDSRPPIAGALAVLLGGPAVGLLIGMIETLFTDWRNDDMSKIAGLLAVSPVFSWAILLIAIPLSLVFARKGFAGWGVAVICGALAGWCFAWIMNVAATDQIHAGLFIPIGVILSLLYWLAIRMYRPASLGIARVTSPTLTRWPILKTDPSACKKTRWQIVIVSALGMMSGSVIIGISFMGIGIALAEISEGSLLAQRLGSIGLVLAFSSLGSWLGFIPALPLALFALAHGFAGWLTAILGGVLAGI